MNRTWLAVLCAAALVAPAGAQGVYRCGNSYSQQRCPGGTAVQVDDSRSAIQRAQNLEAVQRDSKAADAMEKARIKQEAMPAQAVAPTAAKPEEVPPEERKPPEAKPRKPAYFTAVSPKEAKKKKAKKKKSAA